MMEPMETIPSDAAFSTRYKDIPTSQKRREFYEWCETNAGPIDESGAEIQNAVYEYRERVVAGQPYEDTISFEEFDRRYRSR